VKFLVDNQLPLALSRFLNSRGFDSVHVAEVELGSAPDTEIWKFARTSGRVVVSKDDDFLHFALQPEAGTAFVWVRLGNCRKTALLESFSNLLERIEDSLNSGEHVVELRD
jgi:predicted nuclease of predicted toxin-antitoxin system